MNFCEISKLADRSESKRRGSQQVMFSTKKFQQLGKA